MISKRWLGAAAGLIGSAVFVDVTIAQTWRPAVTAPVINWSSIASSADGMRLVAAGGALVAYPGGAGNPAAPIYVSMNAGADWTRLTAPLTTWQSVALSAEGNKLVAVAYDGSILTSTNSGSSWGITNPVPGANWSAVASSADGVTLAIAAMGGGIYSSTNGGASWRPSNAPATNWSWIASSADGVRLVAAQLGDYLNENGGIYTSVDSGRHWSLSGAGAAAWFSVASSADGNRLVAAAFHTNSYNFPGMISISTNAGANWGPAGAPADYWTTVACSADGSKLVAGGSGALYTSTDFGASWTSNSMPYQYWRCVASSADGARLSGVANLDRVYTAIAGPSPLMNSALTEGGLVLSWTWPSSEVVLRQSAELAGLNWNDVTGTPTLVLTNLQYQVTVAASSGQSFYRLEKR